MPDEPTAQTPASSETIAAPAAEAVAPAATVAEPAVQAAENSDLANDKIYDDAFAETMVEKDGAVPAAPVAEAPETETAENPKAETQTQQATQPSISITESEEQVLRRAGFDAEDYAGWTREKIEARVTKLRQSQAEQDRVGAELATLKRGAKPEAETKPNQEPAKPAKSRLAEVREKLVASYDKDIEPLLDVLDQVEAEQGQLRETAAAVPAMTSLLSDLMVDLSLEHLKADYPSLSKPEARQQVIDRFWTEWNTGAYNKPGASMRDQVRSAMTNAAKVTFNNTTEQTAAANLVQANKQRLASQPRTGSPNARPAPRTADDVYNAEFEATIGKELAGRR